jgi:hypothetical protein
MKTRSFNTTFNVLSILSSMGEWQSAGMIKSQLIIPPEVIYRRIENRKSRGDFANPERVKANIVAQITISLCNRGCVEKRKVSGTKNEYRITEKGRLHLEQLKKKGESLK